MNKRVLVIGNNTLDTDSRTENLARKNSSKNLGLITEDSDISQPGYYHSSLADASSGYLIDVAKQVDQVVLLDQPLEEWTSQKIFLSTLKLCQEIERNSNCLLYTSPSPRDRQKSRMPSSA